MYLISIFPHGEGWFWLICRCPDREKWRKKIGGLWRWSEAVPLLKEYYALNGIGRLGFEQGCVSWHGPM